MPLARDEFRFTFCGANQLRRFMHTFLFVVVFASTVPALQVQVDPFARYKIKLDLRKYPQASPKDTLASVVKAINNGDFNYLMAQLAEPEYVDGIVEQYQREFSGPEKDRRVVAFDKLVIEVRQHFRTDPGLANELRQLVEKCDWEIGNITAFASRPGVASYRANFKLNKQRWYFENRRQTGK